MKSLEITLQKTEIVGKTGAWNVDMASIDAMSRPSSNTEGVVASPSPCGEIQTRRPPWRIQKSNPF